ncbi:MAG: ABC transporter ATP-binding protein [Candidatus Omnitrophota bacterium]|nr:ABC transporter ATP-binding protein [Candidatus Omnitrophota bacterium]
MSLLTVEELSVEYVGLKPAAATRAVTGVSFTLEPGEIMALVGGSGCGKTSVALALTKLLPRHATRVAGRVLWQEQNVLEMSDDALRRIRGGTIAYVFQDPSASLNPVLTIGAQLLEAIEHHAGISGAAARQAAVEWLDRVGIASASERLGAYPHEFSGGMQQRVCLAMALAARPALLIADEPTSALDVTLQLQILRLLRDLQRTLHLTVLLISHDLTVVERLAHRVGVMAHGALVELGPAAQILGQPHHSATQELLRCRSMLRLPQG